MKRLQLPKNKFLKLLINVGFVVGWYFPIKYIWQPIQAQIIWNFVNRFGGPWEIRVIQTLLLYLVPIVFVTKSLWFPKRPKITRSKD